MSNRIKTINPANGEPLNSWLLMSKAEVNEQIEKCNSAQQQWRLRSIEERAAVIKAVGAELRKRRGRCDAPRQ